MARVGSIISITHPEFILLSLQAPVFIVFPDLELGEMFVAELTEAELEQLENDRDALQEQAQENERIIRQLEADIALLEEDIAGH